MYISVFFTLPEVCFSNTLWNLKILTVPISAASVCLQLRPQNSSYKTCGRLVAWSESYYLQGVKNNATVIRRGSVMSAN